MRRPVRCFHLIAIHTLENNIPANNSNTQNTFDQTKMQSHYHEAKPNTLPQTSQISQDAASHSSCETPDNTTTRHSSDVSPAKLLKVPGQEQQEQRTHRQQSTPSGPTSRSTSRGRSPSISTERRPSVSTDGKMRKRDILWHNELFDSKAGHTEGPKVRAMSQSQNIPHPEVVEEQMRNMYPQWR